MMEVFTADITAITILGILWGFIFWQFKMMRREMIILSVTAIFLLPLSLSIGAKSSGVDIAQLGIPDLLFAFFVTGLAGVIYHAALGKEYHRTKHHKSSTRGVAELWLMRLFLFVLLFIWGTVIFILLFNMSNVYASLLSALIVGLYIMSHRKNLLLDSLLSALLMGILMTVVGFVSYSVSPESSELLFVESTTLFLGIPTDLLLWGFALGFALGPLYEYVRKLKLDT